MFPRAVTRYLDRALLAVPSHWERLVVRARRRVSEEYADIHPSAVLHPTASVANLRRRPEFCRVGAHTQLRGELLVQSHGGSIAIGEWCYIGDSTRIWSADEIVIGDRVLISHGCEIHDWNAHSLDAKARHEQFRAIVTSGHPKDLKGIPSAPIRIEDDAWIGFRSVVMKGVTIGRGAIVAAGSQVLHDVPPMTIVGGRPARILKEIVDE